MAYNSIFWGMLAIKKLIILLLFSSLCQGEVKELVCSGTETYSYDKAVANGFKTKTGQRALVYEFLFSEDQGSFHMRGHPRLKGQDGEWVAATKLKIYSESIEATFPLSLGKNFKLGNLLKRNTGIATKYSGRLDRFSGTWVSGNTILECTVREARKF